MNDGLLAADGSEENMMTKRKKMSKTKQQMAVQMGRWQPMFLEWMRKK